MRKAFLVGLTLLLVWGPAKASSFQILVEGEVTDITVDTVTLDRPGSHLVLPRSLFAPKDLQIGKSVRLFLQPQVFESILSSLK